MTSLPFVPVGQEPTSSARADVIAVGGAEDKENEKQILWDFFRRAGGEQSLITIVPAASGIPDVLGELYHKIFVGMGVDREHVQVLDIRNPIEARNPSAAELVLRSTGLYFTGGDQERLSEVLAQTELMEVMRQQSLLGKLVIAGTSAGASALGHQMISRGYSGESPTPAIVTMKMGLGILPHVIVDQHFHQRNRLVRLITAVAYHPHCLGIGIDENTAAIIRANDTIEVIGAGTVTIVDGGDLVSTVEMTPPDQLYSLQNARIHFLAPGAVFNIKSKTLLAH
ncbi:MAG: cyanophycinase [Cyanobacteriota bacterium]|nr:cyanophycinase [Cyanobacteriota bacterium]